MVSGIDDMYAKEYFKTAGSHLAFYWWDILIQSINLDPRIEFYEKKIGWLPLRKKFLH